MKTTRNAPKLKERRQELRRNQTEAEKSFWAHVRNRSFLGLRFFRQYSIGPYILDFYCPKANIAVELDGGQHSLDESREYDIARSAFLAGHGIEVMRFWNHDVLQNIDGVLTCIAERITPSDLPLYKGEGMKNEAE
jgi:very-short-patch-repair endonuclease